MKRFLPALFFLIFVVSFTTKGQYTAHLWKTMRYDVFGGMGTNVFMGDLGGGKKVGAHFFGVRDFDIQTTRPTATIGGRMKIRERIALRASVSYARLNGDDKNTPNESRFNRNLNFSTNIWEGALCVEISIKRENRGKRYIFQHQSIFNNMNIYFFGGIAGFHFNPTTKYNGKVVHLKEMRTGGQGLSYTKPGDTASVRVKEYSLNALAYPLGVGIKYYLNKRWSIGMELGVRYSNTDFIDDASGRYFDNETIKNSFGTDVVKGEMAAALADRHITPNSALENENGKYTHGTWVRGDTKYNDSYLFMLFTAVYTFNNRAKYGPKF